MVMLGIFMRVAAFFFSLNGVSNLYWFGFTGSCADAASGAAPITTAPAVTITETCRTLIIVCVFITLFDCGLYLSGDLDIRHCIGDLFPEMQDADTVEPDLIQVVRCDPIHVVFIMLGCLGQGFNGPVFVGSFLALSSCSNIGLHSESPLGDTVGHPRSPVIRPIRSAVQYAFTRPHTKGRSGWLNAPAWRA